MDWRSNIRAYLVVLGGVLVHLSLGTIYSIGNMIPYMVSYIRIHGNARELRNTGAIWVQSAAMSGQAIGMVISGGLLLRFSTRVTTLIGGCVMSAGVAVSYFSIRQSFWLLLFTYGFLFGVGMGIAYTPPFHCAMKWLPAKKGLVAGLVLVGFGGGPFVFNQIQTEFINPDNLIPDEAFTPGSNEKYFTDAEVLDRVPTCFLLLAGCYAALQIIGIILLTDPPKENAITTSAEVLSAEERNVPNSYKMYSEEMIETNNEQLSKVESTDCTETLPVSPQGSYMVTGKGETNEDDEENTKQIQETSSKLEQKQYSVLEMVKTKDFWILYFTFLLNGQGTILVTSMYKAFGQTFIEDDHLLAFVGSFSALFNSIGRPIWGFITDILTYKVAMMFLCSCMCTLMFTLELTRLGGQEMFFVWICAFYFSLSGNYSMIPATVSRRFGTERVGINHGVVFTSQIITSVVGALLASLLQDAIGWFGLFQLTGGMIFISRCYVLVRLKTNATANAIVLDRLTKI